MMRAFPFEYGAQRMSDSRSAAKWQHATMPRRGALQVGSIGLLGLGINHLAGLREANATESSEPANRPTGKAKSCIFIFLSGGLAQHESFDMKPDCSGKNPRRVQTDRHPHTGHSDL